MTTASTDSNKAEAVAAVGIGRIPRGFWPKIVLTAVVFIPLIALASVGLHRQRSPWTIILRIPSLKPNPCDGSDWTLSTWKRSVFSPDARKVLVARQNGAVEIWDVDAGRRLLSLETNSPPEGGRYVACLSWSPDEELVAAWIEGPGDGQARLIVWRANDGQGLWEERTKYMY